jgi:hypothetical protein
MRVNVYKDAIKAASFPPMPNARALAATLAPFHAALREAAPLAVERPVHVITPDEEEAARGFLGAMHEHLTALCGDLRLHTIVNVGMSKRTGTWVGGWWVRGLVVCEFAGPALVAAVAVVHSWV